MKVMLPPPSNGGDNHPAAETFHINKHLNPHQDCPKDVTETISEHTTETSGRE